MKSSNDSLILVVILGVVLYFGGAFKPAPGPTPTPTGPLAAMVTNANDRASIRSFFLDFQSVLKADTTGEIATTHELYDVLNRASTLTATATGSGKYPGFGVAVGDRLKAGVGTLEDVPLTGDVKNKAIATLGSIAAEL